MGEFDQVPFGNVDFADNPSQRVPCVLVLDTSISMSREKINNLNQGLVTFANELQADRIAAKIEEQGSKAVPGSSFDAESHLPGW